MILKRAAFIGAALMTALTPAPAAQQSAGGTKLPDWADYLEAMKPVGDRVIGTTAHPDNPQNRQETWRILMTTLAQGYISHVYNDPDYPEFVPLYDVALNFAAPNADYVYLGTPVRGQGVYRLRGFVGTNRFTDLQLMGGDFAMGGAPGRSLGSYRLNDVQTGTDRSFDIILSAERPKGYTGTWWKMDPQTVSIFFRVASYDWVHERDPLISIDRLDVPPRRPRLSAGELSKRMADLATYIQYDSLPWWKRVGEMRAQGMENKVDFHDWGPAGGKTGQIYVEGLYKLRDDEALILETEVPKTCRYWSFLIGDDQFTTIDWMNHQSSLNGYQAKLDKDGKFRVVIARTDPGVPNWLDTGGYAEGIIQGRWTDCDSKPLPTARLVKLADLRRHLPKDTPIVTPAERDAQLRDRRMGAQFRRRW